ncbi:MAG: hypothetical protein PHR35_21830 [Kiritimatiellae bacterium]|nr:hypothetical protein [Kiritimatiellia bacterium]
MAHEWNIRPRGRRCTICDTAFAEAQECVSALYESEAAYERRDFCMTCWDARQETAPPFSVWQGAFAAPPEAAAKIEPVHRETAESLLRRLVALEDPAHANVVYVLAVMLERKKLLVERDAKPRPEGGILRVYEHRKNGDTFVVLDPQLRLDEIGEVQRQAIELLGQPAVAPPPVCDPSPANGAGAAPE